jgi:hypothetical protein
VAGPKVVSRLVAFLLLVIITAILLFAKKEDHFYDPATLEIYDESVIPRIAICMMSVLHRIVVRYENTDVCIM